MKSVALWQSHESEAIVMANKLNLSPLLLGLTG
jgi:hypothetical protein